MKKSESDPFRNVFSTSVEIPGLPKRTVRYSGHFVDKRLEYRPINSDSFSDSMLAKKAQYGITHEGIWLSVVQDRLIHAIYSLLRDKSQHIDPKSDDFYGGNIQIQAIATTYGGQQVVTSQLKLTWPELFKAYLGNRKISGWEKKNVTSVLFGLTEQRFIFRYKREEKGSKGEVEVQPIEACQSLVKIYQWDGESPKPFASVEHVLQYQKDQTQGEFILSISPLLTDQIGGKYVQYPFDLNRRMIEATRNQADEKADHRKVTESFVRLRDYLLRASRGGTIKTTEINFETLVDLLGLSDYLQSRRNEYVRNSMRNSITFCKNLKLLHELQETTGAKDQIKYVLSINPKFA